MKQNEKQKIAALSVASNSLLIALKLIAGIMSGSVSIISEAIHSGMDLLASIIALCSVHMSSKPADSCHPYGHGKIENMSGTIEGVLIFFAAFFIIKEAIFKLFQPVEITQATLAICVMLFSATINWFISKKLEKVGKAEDSVALLADALHLRTDVYTSLGVALGLVLIQITGISFLDPLVAISVAVLILKEAIALMRQAAAPLLDSALSQEEEAIIHQILSEYHHSIKEYHKLRTRKGGPMRYVDFHMLVDKDLTVLDSHKISDEVQLSIENSLHNTSVQIHVEPYFPKD